MVEPAVPLPDGLVFSTLDFAPRPQRRGASSVTMPRLLSALVCALIFSLPAAMALLMLWPIVVKRTIPSTFDAEAMSIGLVALALGLGASLLLDVRTRG